MASLNSLGLPDQVSILLIYEVIPEDLQIYFIEKPDPTLASKLERLRGKYCGELDLTQEDASTIALLTESLEQYKLADRSSISQIGPIHVKNCKIIVLGEFM